MPQVADVNLKSAMPFGDFFELSKDYCSDHLGRFFQNKYSPPAKIVNTFEIPAKLVANKAKPDALAICVMMNNHIVDLKYLSDVFADGDASAVQSIDMIDLHDQRLLSVIKHFKKINDEIVIGRCRGHQFIPL